MFSIVVLVLIFQMGILLFSLCLRVGGYTKVDLVLARLVLYCRHILFIIMLSVNFFCNISSYDILAYITKNYIALIYYAKIVHLLCQFHAGKVRFSAVCQAIYS